MQLKFRTIIYAALTALTVFDLGLFLASHTFWWVQLPLGLPILLLLPGALLMIILGARQVDTKNVLIATGLSVLSLLLIGLTANYLPEAFGVQRPLDNLTILAVYHGFLALEFGALLLLRQRITLITLPIIRFNKIDTLLLAGNLLAILCAVFGAYRLNNGASNAVSMGALAAVFLLLLLATWQHKKLSTLTLVTTIGAAALAILLLTSLRSWDVTGHDVKVEYMVYSLTTQFGKWDISHYRNAYNACMSITILPVVFAKLLHVDGLVVFKFIDQVLFALVPIGVFILARRFVSRRLAFIAGAVFISFPTFAVDSPMLTRQELAFFFFILVLIAWFGHSGTWLKRRWRELFLLFSLGIILSHYSTTYMYVALLILTYLGTYAYELITRRQERQARLSLTMISVIFLTAFLWYSQASQVAGGLTNALGNSVSNITNLFDEDNRGSQVNYALFGFSSSKSQQLNEYINATKAAEGVDAGQAMNSLGFMDNNLPMPAVGQRLAHSTPIDVGHLTNLLYYAVAPRLYQLVVVGGVLLLLFSQKVRQRFRQIPVQYGVLCVAGVIVLGLQLVLPNISLSYGLMRAFQQCLLFFTLPMVVMLYLLGKRLMPWFGVGLVTLYALGNLVLFTNFLPQILGGVPPALSLNNGGPYYGAYYTFQADIAATQWLQATTPRGSDARALCFSSAKAHDPTLTFSDKNILPFQVLPGTYVQLCHNQLVDRTAYISVAHNLLPVSIKPGMYNDKNIIYSNTDDIILK